MRFALCALAAAVVSSPSYGAERPASVSTTYRACTAAAASQADDRECLAGEVQFEQAALSAAVAGTGVDAESQALWERSMRHDCEGEYALAGGGNSADMRQMACEIEQTATRVDYLLRRGEW